MNLLPVIRAVGSSIWGGIKTWIESGRRLRDLERLVSNESAASSRERALLRGLIENAIEEEKRGREQIHRRMTTIEETHLRRIDALAETQRKRVDDWAMQLSGQINQVYAAIASSPVSSRKS